jgi:hypothetical protein
MNAGRLFLKGDNMNEIRKVEFDALKEDYERLKKAHVDLWRIVQKIVEELEGLISIAQNEKTFGEETYIKSLTVRLNNLRGINSRLLKK